MIRKTNIKHRHCKKNEQNLCRRWQRQRWWQCQWHTRNAFQMESIKKNRSLKMTVANFSIIETRRCDKQLSTVKSYLYQSL